MKLCLQRFYLILAGLLCWSGVHARQNLTLAAGERPPYLGQALPDGGYVADVVREAFRRKGYHVTLQFSTAARARLQAGQGEVAGVIAADSGDGAGLAWSERLPGGSTVLLKKRSLSLPDHLTADPAQRLRALAQFRFGAVRDGASVTQFDTANYLDKELYASDLQVLDALDQGQVQLAVLDKTTAADLMVSQRPKLIGQLEPVNPPLARADVAIGFARRKANHEQLLAVFNAALAQMRQDGTLEKIMHKHGLFAARPVDGGKVHLTVGTVDNGDMMVMQGLAREFERQNPGIVLHWRVLDEHTLRRRLLGDLALADGQFDVMTIGTYELPIWVGRGWLAPLGELPKGYDADDLLPTLRRHLRFDDQWYALPFYAESAMTYYRKDLFAQADLARFAARLHKPQAGQYGICLRGKPGWGENMALISSMVHAHGGRWFDPQWRPELATPLWNKVVADYVDLLTKYGPPHPAANGFNENLDLFAHGHCAIWVDATVAGMLFDARRSQVSAQLGFAPAPIAGERSDGAWLWSWALAIPSASQHKAQAAQFIAWATSQAYIRKVAQQHGWIAVPPGTRKSTYTNAQYAKAAPFASFVLKAIEAADVGMDPRRPYEPVQYVSIPAFQAIGERAGADIAAALTGEQSVDKALRRAQNYALEQMQGTAEGR